MGLTRAQLSNIELARSPLRYIHAARALGADAVALSDWRASPNPFNPMWLFGEDWPIQLSWPLLLPEPGCIGLSPSLRFSEFVTQNLPLLQRFASDSPDTARLPESWLGAYEYHWIRFQLGVGRLEHQDLVLMDIIARSALDLADTSAAARRVLLDCEKLPDGSAYLSVERAARRHAVELPPKPGRKKTSSLVLTPVRGLANIAAMKSPLANLLKRLNRTTATKGMKAELASCLGVPRSCISDWLSGRREPGGETTLKLLNWVERQEAHQTTRPGGALTPPGPKTRSQSSNEKKPRSNPP